MACSMSQVPAGRDDSAYAACFMSTGITSAFAYENHARGCKRKHDSRLQGASPPPSAVATQVAHAFEDVPYASGCPANRSASMDSEASSYSPLPKRHCFQASQGPGTPDGLQHIQRWQHPHVQQPASLPRSVPLLSHDSQHLCALKHMLQHGTPQQVALVVAYLQQLQRLRYAAVNHTTSAVSVQQPHDHPATSDAPSLMALKVCHQYVSCQQQQLASSLSHQNRLDHRRSSFDGFMHQLHHIHTPTQNQETQASSGRDLPHTAAHWQDSARGEASSLPYLPTHVVAAQQALNQPTYREQRQHGCAARIQQPQCPSYALVAAPDGQSTQAPAPHPAAHMLQLQRDTKIQQQLDQARRVRLQQHLIAQQQQRQLMSHDQQARGQGVVVTPSRQVLGFAELVTYWAKGLSLQRCESVHLACHLWAKVQQQVSIAYMHLLGAEKPWETMLLGCLWVAAKLEECRRGVPTASKVGACLSVDKAVMGGVELYLMQLVNWAPLLGWQNRPLLLEDRTWC